VDPHRLAAECGGPRGQRSCGLEHRAISRYLASDQPLEVVHRIVIRLGREPLRRRSLASAKAARQKALREAFGGDHDIGDATIQVIEAILNLLHAWNPGARVGRLFAHALHAVRGASAGVEARLVDEKAIRLDLSACRQAREIGFDLAPGIPPLRERKLHATKARQAQPHAGRRQQRPTPAPPLKPRQRRTAIHAQPNSKRE
jgi:hypothetical protein